MVFEKYKSGDTIRIYGEFENFSGQLSDPTNIKLIIYDFKYKKLEEFSNGIERESTGKYYFDYLVPTDRIGQTIIYEWNGELDGSISLDRGKFGITFVD